MGGFGGELSSGPPPDQSPINQEPQQPLRHHLRLLLGQEMPAVLDRPALDVGGVLAPDVEHRKATGQAGRAPQREQRHGELVAGGRARLVGLEVVGIGRTVVVEGGAQRPRRGEGAHVLGHRLLDRGAVVGPALEEPAQVALDVAADEQLGQVGLQVEQPVPEASGELRVQAAEPRPGRDDVEHGEPLDLVRVVERVAVGDPGAAVVPDQGDAPVAELLHQRAHVPGHGALVVAAGRLVAQRVAAQVGGDHGEPLRQRRQQLAPAVPGLRPAVQQHDRRPVALLDVVDADPVDRRHPAFTLHRRSFVETSVARARARSSAAPTGVAPRSCSQAATSARSAWQVRAQTSPGRDSSSSASRAPSSVGKAGRPSATAALGRPTPSPAAIAARALATPAEEIPASVTGASTTGRSRSPPSPSSTARSPPTTVAARAPSASAARSAAPDGSSANRNGRARQRARMASTRGSWGFSTPAPGGRVPRTTAAFTSASSSRVSTPPSPRWSTAMLVTTATSLWATPRPRRRMPPRAVSSTASSTPCWASTRLAPPGPDQSPSSTSSPST